MEAIRECGFDSGFDLAELDERKEMLDREINEELYYSEDIYDIVTFKDGAKYYRQKVVFEKRSLRTQSFHSTCSCFQVQSE